MESIGIKFSYVKAVRRQVLTQDGYLPIPDLILDERLAIILARSQLGELQESFLAKHARAAASKLLASQDDSFCKAEIIEPQWLRDEAIKTIRTMAQHYKQ